MSEPARPTAQVVKTPRRLLWGALLMSGVAIAAIALLFVWPSSEPESDGFDLGAVDDYSIRSVTTVEEGGFHLVRLDEETFIALSWIDPHLGCTVPWRPDFSWEGTLGWFRNPCHGETYNRAGLRVFGPSPRDLDRFVISIEDGRIIVDTRHYVCGFAPPDTSCGAPTPAP